MKLYKLSASIAIASAALIWLVKAEALDRQTPQVMIEARLMTTSLDYSRELGVDFAFAQKMEGGKLILDASTVAMGTGGDLESWTPIKTYIETGSGIVLPDLTKPIQIPVQLPALETTAQLLAAISSRYIEYTLIAQASPGTFSTVHIQSMPEEETLDIGDLLTGEADATLNGMKSRFMLSELPPLNVLFKAEIEHKTRPDHIIVEIPLAIGGFGDDEAFRDAVHRAQDAYSTKEGRPAKTYIDTGIYFPQIGVGTGVVNPAPDLPGDTHGQQAEGSGCPDE